MKIKFTELLKEEKDQITDETRQKILDFFRDEPYPADSKVHAFAEKMGMKPEELEEQAYAILSTFLSSGRFNESKKKESDFDKDEIAKGIKIEMEHLDSKSPYAPFLAKRITFDHNAEFKTYNTALLKMEDELKKDK